MQRMLNVYSKAAWINPEAEALWTYRQSIGVLREIMGGRMYPATINGLERCMRALTK